MLLTLPLLRAGSHTGKDRGTRICSNWKWISFMRWLLNTVYLLLLTVMSPFVSRLVLSAL